MIEDVRGVAFPFRVDPATGSIDWASGTDKIRQNVRIVLSTRVGERPMLRDFGSRLHALVHEPNDAAIADILRNQAQQALLQWEPRILTTQAEVQQFEGEARLRVTYILTDSPFGGELIVPLL